MSQIIIFGSARSEGNTKKAVKQIIGEKDIPLVDLKAINIQPYDYEYRNQADGFIPLIERVLKFETIIIATPVYWYSMSGVMKNFFDRITDLLDVRKDLGRQLRGKKLFVIASYGGAYPDQFDVVFEKISDYLGITYLGSSIIFSGNYDTALVDNNKKELEKALKIFA